MGVNLEQIAKVVSALSSRGFTVSNERGREGHVLSYGLHMKSRSGFLEIQHWSHGPASWSQLCCQGLHHEPLAQTGTGLAGEGSSIRIKWFCRPCSVSSSNAFSLQELPLKIHPSLQVPFSCCHLQSSNLMCLFQLPEWVTVPASEFPLHYHDTPPSPSSLSCCNHSCLC